MNKYDDLIRKLKEVFQIDRPELDFGIYRILNARAGEVTDYLENRLKAQVAGSFPSAEYENAVFTHLLTFFSRYYDKGDFISQRRYKGDTYAIPYSGEEVVLHWANKDQYYTKSGENFSNYAFKLQDGRTVQFRLVAADTAKDNRKDNDKDRQFVLIDRHTRKLADENGEEYEQEFLPVEEVGNELVIRFDYKPMPKGSKQEHLSAKAVEAILADTAVQSRWRDLSRREPTEKNPQRTLLEKCLNSYTAKNSADYFIHKELGTFLRRELDFYIKNEVMRLDDVQSADSFSDIEKSLRLIQVLRAIALDLIAFLAQLEDFQKKLWLKKKFVIAANYCVTLDRVPVELLQVIADNPAQWQRWETLGMLAETDRSVEYLKSHRNLMVDTGLHGPEIKQAILNAVDDHDASTDGVLVHGENFQAMNLLTERYKGQVKCCYFDPPYNTGKDGFLYKDSYSHSTWISFIANRLETVTNLLQDDGAVFCSIDDNEAGNLEAIVGSGNLGLTMPVSFFVQVRSPNKTLSEDSDYHKTIERVLLLAKATKSFSPVKETVPYSIDKFEWRISELSEGLQIDAGGKKVEVFKPGAYEITKIAPQFGGLKETWATGSLARQKGSSGEFLELNLAPRKQLDGLGCLYKVYGIGEDGLGYRYFTGPKREDATKGKFYSGIPLSTLEELKAGNALKDLPIANFYDFAGEFGNCRQEGGVDISGGKKPEKFVAKFIRMASEKDRADLILDPFAGSGTTPSVALQLGKKFLGVEVGDYFHTKVMPRIQRTYFGGSSAIDNTPRSGMFKYLELESYEDTLNNLNLTRTQAQQDMLNAIPDAAKDDYLLRYMLDVESRGSLLSVDQFSKPFDCTLKVAVDSAGACHVRSIDLVETFNYLIGLRVRHIEMQLNMGFVAVTGALPSGEKALVLWRDTENLDYEKLNRLFEKLAINPADSEFGVVYINGDHNIASDIAGTIKIRQIEPEFMSRMFSPEA
jgi:adenine-specific DNA-methyltransferase